MLLPREDQRQASRAVPTPLREMSSPALAGIDLPYIVDSLYSGTTHSSGRGVYIVVLCEFSL